MPVDKIEGRKIQNYRALTPAVKSVQMLCHTAGHEPSELHRARMSRTLLGSARRWPIRIGPSFPHRITPSTWRYIGCQTPRVCACIHPVSWIPVKACRAIGEKGLGGEEVCEEVVVPSGAPAFAAQGVLAWRVATPVDAAASPRSCRSIAAPGTARCGCRDSPRSSPVCPPRRSVRRRHPLRDQGPGSSRRS